MQKIFPIILLDGSGLVIKLVVSLLLFLAFDPVLFVMGLFFVLLLTLSLYWLGRHGVGYALERSDAKHDSIHYLQRLPLMDDDEERLLETLDARLLRFVCSRVKLFGVLMRQLGLIYFMDGLVFVSFLVVGGYMVTQGQLPLGEFIATEVAVVYLMNALKSFMKQLDYLYDIVEGLYKVEKLARFLEGETDAKA
ncbi:hypothetical protein [Hydrogenimonas sp.]